MNTLAAFPIAVRVSFDTFTPSGSCRYEIKVEYCHMLQVILGLSLVPRPLPGAGPGDEASTYPYPVGVSMNHVLHATLTASLIIRVTTEAGRLRSSGFSAIAVARSAQTPFGLRQPNLPALFQ